MDQRIGIDVGGTFTDFVVANRETGSLNVWKTPTTRPDPSDGIFEGFRQLVEEELVVPEAIREVSIGTTVVLNAILERHGSSAGMLVTRGFRDVLEIGRESRRLLYDLHQEKLPVLVPREFRREVEERSAWTGDESRPLNEAEVIKAANELVSEGAEALAICFLHSYANPTHELQAKRLVLTRHPDIPVCSSHEVSSDYREYERWLLAALNAYVMPVMQRYLDGVERGLAALNPKARTYITHSAGGVMNTAVARVRPIQSAMSGPAAGVLGAVHTAALQGVTDFITMDMGGTSCDVAIVQNGRGQMSSSADLGGYKVGLRTVNVQSISAGGGTVAWMDSGGFLRVGPESAGSDPGPAAYGRGGVRPTVTDAHLVLGHIDTESVLGSSIHLDTLAASAAIEAAVAKPLGVSIEEAASGIIAIADAAMVRAIEVVSIEQGHDPRDYAIVAFGGAAPLHAAKIASELGVEHVMVPRLAGVLSALGTLFASESHEATESILKRLGEVDERGISDVLSRLRAQALGMLGMADAQQSTVELSLDMRYVGQTSVLEVPWVGAAGDGLASLRGAFEEQYVRTFGYAVSGRDAEVAAARAVVRVPRVEPKVPILRPAAAEPPRRSKAYFYGGDPRDALLYGLEALVPGVEISGPAIVNTGGSTALILPDQHGEVDDYGNLLIRVRQSAADPASIESAAVGLR